MGRVVAHDAVWFNRQWQFSNGCTFEFAVAVDAGLPTFDHDGGDLNLETAYRLISEAIRTLDVDGFDTASMRQNLDRIEKARPDRVAGR